MTLKLFLSIAIWFLMMFLAILNGTVRNYLYKPYVGDLTAHQISSFIFILVMCLLVGIFLKTTPVRYSQGELLLIGFFWLVATIFFEFGFGYYVMKNPWQKLTSDYNILEGRVWGLVLLTELLSPLMIGNFLFR